MLNVLAPFRGNNLYYYLFASGGFKVN